MDRERAPNRWQDWRFTIAEVVADEDAFGAEPRVLRDDGKVRRTLYPGFTLELHRRPGRRLLPQPQLGRAGVVRRLANRRRRSVARLAGDGQRLATPRPGAGSTRRSASTTCRCSADLVAWLQAYTDEHYRPEEKKARRRPQSFVRAVGAQVMATATGSCRAGRAARPSARERRADDRAGAPRRPPRRRRGDDAVAAAPRRPRRRTARLPAAIEPAATPDAAAAADARRRRPADDGLRLLAATSRATSTPASATRP